MGWFKHRHWWIAKTELNRVMGNGADKAPTGCLFLEYCTCGAIRQIEYAPGKAPTIFVTECPKATP